ncbi:MAG: hypothetical protein ACRCZD_03880, partial [Phycicoccus sp.]
MVRAQVPRVAGSRSAGTHRTGEGPTHPVVPAAVSALSAHLLAGPAQPADVLGSGTHGCYLGLAGTVLPVLTVDAVALPTALRLPRTVDATAFVGHGGIGHSPSAGHPTPVVVGDGVVRLGRMTVRASRIWHPARVRRRHPGRSVACSVHPWVPPVSAHLVRPAAA